MGLSESSRTVRINVGGGGGLSAFASSANRYKLPSPRGCPDDVPCRDTMDLSRRHFRVNSANAPVITPARGCRRRLPFRLASPLLPAAWRINYHCRFNRARARMRVATIPNTRRVIASLLLSCATIPPTAASSLLNLLSIFVARNIDNKVQNETRARAKSNERFAARHALPLYNDPIEN